MTGAAQAAKLNFLDDSSSILVVLEDIYNISVVYSVLCVCRCLFFLLEIQGKKFQRCNRVVNPELFVPTVSNDIYYGYARM